MSAGDLLVAEPQVLTGGLIGYARVSTTGQLLDTQQHQLAAAGCQRVFADKLSGRTADHAELDACLDYLRAGDTLVVTRLDRLARSLQDLITIVADLRRRGVGFRSLHENLDTTTPGGRLVFHVFAALAEFIRELIVQGTHEGLAAARARGVRLGRPPALNAEQIYQARQMLTRPDNSVASIARLLGVSRSTLYAQIPELAGGRNSAALTGDQTKEPQTVSNALPDPFDAEPGGTPTVVAWIAELYADEPGAALWTSLDDRLRLALAQGWILGATGQEDQAAAEALAERQSEHPDFETMLADLTEHWQSVYTRLQDGVGVWQRTEIAGANLELVVLTAAEDAGPVTAGDGFLAHQFITRFTGDGWVIAATARRLPVPGWPPSEDEIPGLLG